MINKRGESFLVRKCYDPVSVSCHPFGEDTELEYRLERDKHYNSIYQEVGKRSVREYVNSFKTGCSLKAIIDRCALMPVHDKVRYLQQREDGVSADLSFMPQDGVEAQIMLMKLKTDHPDIVHRLSQGETLDAILKSFGSDSVPGVSQNQTKEESEVNANG